MARQQQNKIRGGAGFEQYYSSLFGGRWPLLKEALLKAATPVPFYAGGEETYYLDSASILAALTLPLEGAKNILDMCAAPGGKSLVLASRMEADARITCNERSFERCQRLRRVIATHLAEDVKERVTVTCGDAAVLCKKQGAVYDAILLDAPCSSERHVLTESKYLADWSPSRIKTLSMQQWALLSSAYRLLKEDGFILYSTCALNPLENSEVIQRLVKKFPDALLYGRKEIAAIQETACKKNQSLLNGIALPDYESVFAGDFSDVSDIKGPEIGFSILPDRQGGAGPIYFCLIKKALHVA